MCNADHVSLRSYHATNYMVSGVSHATQFLSAQRHAPIVSTWCVIPVYYSLGIFPTTAQSPASQYMLALKLNHK